jgi:hypothetical protein
MKANPSFKAMLFALPVVMTTSSCLVSGIEWGRIQEITYAFLDASVPPEYHRSYMITVTANTASVVIDSYGDELANEVYETTGEQFIDLKNSLATNRIRSCFLGDDSGCSGGTSESVTYSDDEGQMFSGMVYHCGGRDFGSLCGDVASFAASIRSLVPDFEALMRGTEGS